MGSKLKFLKPHKHFNLAIVVFLLFINCQQIVSQSGRSRQNVRGQRIPSTRRIESDLSLNSADLVTTTKNNILRTTETKSSSACECMDYWDCAARNGQVYSYCGISDGEVCCFMSSTESQNSDTNSSEVIFEDDPIPTTSFSDSELPTTSTVELDFTDADVNATTIANDFREKFESLPFENRGCGNQTVPFRLDSKAQFGEWPWHVAILEVTEDLYICGGALVSENRVVTAAHCLSAYAVPDGPRLKIRAGEFDVSGNLEAYPHVEVLIDMVAIHPEFDNASLINDIAIVGLNRNINFTQNIQPLCLPNVETPRTSRTRITPKSQCVVTGWGRISEDSQHSIILKEVITPLWNSDNCQRRLRQNFGSTYKLPSTTICAGDQGTDAAICDGDGGGPLACLQESNGKWYHEGIVSFGIGCGGPDSPGVYTRVSSYLKWIRSYL